MKYKVRVLRRAQQDVAACYAFIAARSPVGAARWFHRFEAARDRLTFDAEKRPLAYESELVERDIREVLFKTRHGLPYRIVFDIRGDEVLVLRVRGPGQDQIQADEIE